MMVLLLIIILMIVIIRRSNLSTEVIHIPYVKSHWNNSNNGSILLKS